MVWHNLNYDYDIDETYEHLYVIFEIKGGRVVDHADDAQEAIAKIEKLELEKALK